MAIFVPPHAQVSCENERKYRSKCKLQQTFTKKPDETVPCNLVTIMAKFTDVCERRAA